MLLIGDIEPRDGVTVDVTKGDLHFDVEQGRAREEVSDWSEEAEEAKTTKSTAAR
jgi:hypothetical protein